MQHVDPASDNVALTRSIESALGCRIQAGGFLLSNQIVRLANG